jgi:AraC-like DNA-binding protein
MLFVRKGGACLLAGGQLIELPTGQLALFWAAAPHRLVLGAGAEIISVRVPLRDLLGYQLGAAFLGRVLSGKPITDLCTTSWDDELFVRWLSDLESEDAEDRRTAEIEVEARVRRIAHALGLAGEPAAVDHASLDKAERLVGWASTRYTEESLRPELERAANCPIERALALFRRVCGMSLSRYLTRLRLSHAQDLLLSTDQTVLAVALDSGFASIASFYSLFVRETGDRPRRYRHWLKPARTSPLTDAFIRTLPTMSRRRQSSVLA